MSGNVTVGIQSYKIEQNFEEGKLILDLYVDNPEGDVQKYAKFIDDFETFLKEKGYAIPKISAQGVYKHA